MKTILLFFVSFCTCSIAHSQVIDSFDKRLNWQGDTSKFEWTEGQLHLNDTSHAGPAFIYLSSPVSLNATWEITVKMNFAPSSSNFLDIILLSDTVGVSFNGYFLHIGKSGSDDALELHKQTGENSELLGEGLSGRFSEQLDSFRIQVIRDSLNLWTIKSDLFDSNGFTEEMVLIDSTHLKSNYFGLNLNYTSTRSDKFYFDDLSIQGDVFIDNIPPSVVNYVLINDHSIQVTFDEPVQKSFLSGFSLNNEPPDSILWSNDQVILYFKPFTEDVPLPILIQNIKDKSENALESWSDTFIHHTATAHDMVISEVLFNPDKDIPEYLELYNNTSVTLDLSDFIIASYDLEKGTEKWSLTADSTYHLLPDEYYVITSNKLDLLGQYDAIENHVIEIPLPTLRNENDWLKIYTQDSLLIDEAIYDESYHSKLFTSAERKGKSLERIDLDVSGLSASNWFTSSSQNSYASPTFQNSQDSYSNESLEVISFNRLHVSPDGDGFEDFILLYLSNKELGTTLNVSLFSLEGFLEQKLIQNELLGNDGQIKLDFSQDGFNPSMGFHLLLIELNSPNGLTQRFRKTITVNKRF